MDDDRRRQRSGGALVHEGRRGLQEARGLDLVEARLGGDADEVLLLEELRPGIGVGVAEEGPGEVARRGPGRLAHELHESLDRPRVEGGARRDRGENASKRLEEELALSPSARGDDHLRADAVEGCVAEDRPGQILRLEPHLLVGPLAGDDDPRSDVAELGDEPLVEARRPLRTSLGRLPSVPPHDAVEGRAGAGHMHEVDARVVGRRRTDLRPASHDPDVAGTHERPEGRLEQRGEAIEVRMQLQGGRLPLGEHVLDRVRHRDARHVAGAEDQADTGFRATEASGRVIRQILLEDPLLHDHLRVKPLNAIPSYRPFTGSTGTLRRPRRSWCGAPGRGEVPVRANPSSEAARSWSWRAIAMGPVASSSPIHGESASNPLAAVVVRAHSSDTWATPVRHCRASAARASAVVPASRCEARCRSSRAAFTSSCSRIAPVLMSSSSSRRRFPAAPSHGAHSPEANAGITSAP